MRRAPLRILRAASALLASSLLAGPAFAATVIVHRAASVLEDGVPGVDPDAKSHCVNGTCAGGTRNGQGCSEDRYCPDTPDNFLALNPGTIHVVANNYTVQGPYNPETNSFDPFFLYIKPGAIVKIASDCTQDGSGNIVSCSPTTFGGGQLYTADHSVLAIEGATVTDIRDDTVGGDTNHDGSATTPVPSYLIRFGGSPNLESLLNSTIRYATIVGHFGTMEVDGNTFEKCGGVGYFTGSGIYKTNPPVRGAFLTITDNTFDFVGGTSGPGGLDVRGTTTVVWGNHISGNGSGGVTIGPMWEEGYTRALPDDGRTVVAYNDISTKLGIVTEAPGGTSDSILQQTRFRADIHDNHLSAPGVVSSVGLALSIFSDTNASSNVVENYETPFQLRINGVTGASSATAVPLMGLHLHNNSFLLAGAKYGASQPYDALWHDFHAFVDAELNWWGDATGPKDSTNADGLVNPPGVGLALSNGIDYAPFLKEAAPIQKDSIHLKAKALPPPPFTKDIGDVVFSVQIDDYQLASASSGTITVYLKNSHGDVLVAPVSKNVSKKDHAVDFGSIDLPEVPRFSSSVVVEAVLLPAGPIGGEVRSKPKVFPITKPYKGDLYLGCVDNPDVTGDCDPFEPVPGNTSHLALPFTYRSSTTVHGHFKIEERRYADQALLATYPTTNFTAPASQFGASTQYTTYAPKLFDVNDDERFLYLYYWAEDETGDLISEDKKRLEIAYHGNELTGAIVAVDSDLKVRPGTGGHLLVGEHPKILVDTSWLISTTGVTWRLELSEMQVRNKDEFVLHTYSGRLLQDGLTTGTGKYTEVVSIDNDVALPAGSYDLKLSVRLYAPNQGVVVSQDVATIPVASPGKVSTKAIPAGLSNTTFSPISRFELNVTANPSPGSMTAEEYVKAIVSPNSASTLVQPAEPAERLSAGAAAFSASAAVEETRLIPINRYWSIYDSLSDTGLTANATFTYDTADFPDDAAFDEDSLVVAVVHPLSGALLELPPTHDKSQHTVTAAYNGFYGYWTVASKVTGPVATCGDPTADGKSTATDALYALRVSVGTAQCAKCICDVNENGTVTSTDALLILKVAVGQLPAPTCTACG